ncbi:uncharacterized protein [Haliotis cracherodii]|uniref:uncharacterized protein n=1 Tax=Haliotis cracherodii TaxID=6455 RepID=UPI0039E79728
MFLFSVFTMCDPALMEVIIFCQEGEKHYNEGKIDDAITSFENALEKAKSTEDRHFANVCIYNLASVYAANRDQKKWEQKLKDLSYQSNELKLPEGENSMTYLQAIANRSPLQYEQALEVTSDGKKQIYLLEQLVKQCKGEQDIHKQIEYLKRLQTVYKVQREDIRCLEVACQRARLLYRENNKEASLEVLKEVEMELGEYERPRKRGTQEKRCPLPIWNELGLMYTLLKKEDKALQCFENGLKLIHDKTPASILKTAVLKQNIGAVRNIKDDFALAKKSHVEAILQYAEYVAEKKRSTSNGKSPQNKEPQGIEEKRMYSQLKGDNGVRLIYEALKDDKEAAAGAARSYINLGVAQVKLERIMLAFEAYSQANVLARTAGDRHTRMQACEALASFAMRHRDTRAARRYLYEALSMEVHETPPKVVGADQPEYASYNFQRIAEKLSQLPMTPHDSP